MLATHRLVTTYRDYAIYQRDPGFEFTPMLLGKVASFLVTWPENQVLVCAFMYALLDTLAGETSDETVLLARAIETITAWLDDHEPHHRAELTFELRDGRYEEVAAPRWWIPTSHEKGIGDRG